MDLESPLRTIAAPVEAEVLRVLAAADSEFSAPQIHRLTDSASPYGVRKALARLATTGLVVSVIRGTSTLWRGNRDHVLWPAIESAVSARRALLDRLEKALAQHEGLIAAYVYGSFARRTAKPDSDIDLLLVYEDAVPDEGIVDSASALGQQITTWTGNEGHIYNTTRSSLRYSIESSDSVMRTIRDDATPLTGPEFDQLLQLIGATRRASA